MDKRPPSPGTEQLPPYRPSAMHRAGRPKVDDNLIGAVTIVGGVCLLLLVMAIGALVMIAWRLA